MSQIAVTRINQLLKNIIQFISLANTWNFSHSFSPEKFLFSFQTGSMILALVKQTLDAIFQGLH